MRIPKVEIALKAQRDAGLDPVSRLDCALELRWRRFPPGNDEIEVEIACKREGALSPAGNSLHLRIPRIDVEAMTNTAHLEISAPKEAGIFVMRCDEFDPAFDFRQFRNCRWS